MNRAHSKKCLSLKRGPSGPRTLLDVPARAEKERKKENTDQRGSIKSFLLQKFAVP